MKTNTGFISSFLALKDIALKTQARTASLKIEQDLQTQWTGIGFQLLGVNWVAPMAQINEILEVPSITALPNVKSWVLGVANIRGRLLPVINLAQFFDRNLINPKKTHRILVLESDELYVGLVVDQSFGIQHFKLDDYYDDVALNDVENSGFLTSSEIDFLQNSYNENPLIKSCTRGFYLKGDQCWFVMNMLDLILSDKFSIITQKI